MCLLCILFFGLGTKVSHAQEKIIIDQDQSIPVDEVFKIIQQQSNYHFIFPKKLFENAPNVQLEKGEILIIDLLKKSLQNSNLRFELNENNTILIKKNELTESATQDKVTITGKVLDTNGLELIGVTVLEKETSNGVASDFSGSYSISVSKNAILEFSFIGFHTKTLAVADLSYFSNVDVILTENVNVLQEVVVTGYQKLLKARTAGAYEQVGVAQLQQRPSKTNIIDRIFGQTAGLNSDPRFVGSFEIRGRNSIVGIYARPLIVIDGFPMADQDNIESINPEDVETVTVLKDASASSIWGSRAANGVVVIVTKRGGKNSPMRVDFSAFTEMEEKVDLSNLNLMTTTQEIALDQEFIEKRWTNLNGLASSPNSINDLHLAYLYRNGLAPDGIVWSQNTFDNYINALKQRNIDKDWEKYLLRSALQTTYNLSISGGGEKNAFFGSLSYVDKLGQLIGDANDRITMNLRNTYEFNDKVSFTAGMAAVLRNEKDNYLTAQYGLEPIRLVQLAQPYDQLVDENGQYVQKYYSWNPWLSQDREAQLGVPYTYNVLEEQRNIDNSSTLVDIRADFKLDIEVLKDLVVSSSFRYERNTNDLDAFKSMNMPSWRNTVNDHYVFDPDTGNYQYGIPLGAEYLQERTYAKGWVFKNTVIWDKIWNDHLLTVFAGGEYSRSFNEFSRNRKFGYDKESTSYLPINEVDLIGRRITNWAGESFDRYFSNTLVFDVNNQDNRFVSVFSNLGYTFKRKYTLNGSFRIDQANIFGSNPDFRYKPLWSSGMAWDMAKEPFLENVNWLDRLKLRLTYGLGGNSLEGVYPHAAAFVRNIYWGNQYNGLVLRQPANPDLKWEETATTNVGLDFAFFNNRVSGGIDYYIKKSSDVYTSRALDPTVGWTAARVNYADIENKGVELQLNADLIRAKAFEWSVRANFNYNKNTLTKANLNNTSSADAYTIDIAFVEGKPISATYAYNFAGLDSNGEVLLYDLEGNTRSWRDNITIEELKYTGHRTPKHYGGLSTTLNYKGLDLTVNMNYQADFVFRMSYNYASTGFGTDNNNDFDFSNIRVHKEWAKRWMQPGDEAFTSVPKIFYNGLNPNTGEVESRFDTFTMHRIWNQSTHNVHKGDYIRVQDIILGYTMPKKVLGQTFFKSLRLTMQVTNPFLWVANDLGVDPLAPNSEAYTNLTRYTLGLRALF